MKHKILCIIDCQEDFITGALKNEEAIKAVPKIVKKAQEFDGEYIFITRDTHNEDYLDTKEGKHLPIPHCIKGTPGWMLNSDLSRVLTQKDVKEEHIIAYFDKPTFGSTALVKHISRISGELEIEICGFCTDICVISNALMIKGAVNDRADIAVDSECCAGTTPEAHKAALGIMENCQIEIQ